ncbi:LysR family transcriptional regulator [Agaribacter marinus]|uniref:LysR family transcriptional regulator n=1 Tax=Agaribacter marinus TaxID=1431249 RepID=A0AA37SX06_9ALTE|nr:LysR family transcriptional regulator [Agaribacter marinus]GLR71353.1 LysR family transcriptional regulator [Agaribacter marinus]
MDRITTMNAFVTVANEGSFTKAAEKLDISNQLVSKYVSHLEELLNTRLFNRTTRKVHLTEAGEQCFQHAQHILESMNDMEGYFGQLTQEAQGILNINAPVSFSTLHLAQLLADFKLKYPAITVNLQLNDRKIDVIEEGFDLALRIGSLKNSSMIAKKLASVRLVLCASPDYINKHGKPNSPEELIPEHYLRYSHMESHQNDSPLLNILTQKKYRQGANFVSNNGEVLTAAAVAGQGYVYQPTFIAGEALKQGKLQIILPEFEPNPVGLYAVYPHRKLLASKLRVFLAFFDDYYGSPPYWDHFNT